MKTELKERNTMKIRYLLVICSFYFFSSAFSQKIMSLYPLFNEQDAVLIPEIEGLWSIPDFDMTVSFQKAGDNFYLLKYGSEENASVFEAVFVKISDELMLGLSGVMPDTFGDEDYRSSFIRGHSFYKITVAERAMQLFELNYSWFYDHAIKNNSPLKYEWIQKGMLLTIRTDDLKSFFTEHCKDQNIFSSPLILKREQDFVYEKADNIKHDRKAESKDIVYRNCNPEFPLKDGWLGGDGDVSVPLNSTTTLFIFSDTYVGKKGQHNRMETGLKMVSNSVAVETCLPDGTTEVKYFWSNMYSENPGPIFETYTHRYRFWVNDAFMVNDNLYVVLEKVGSKPDVSPDDIFSFSLLGFTLAKISNPVDSPDNWKIELIPLKDFGNPFMGLRCHVKLGSYIYFFVSRYDKAQVLVRKHLDFIDNPEEPFEYFALNKIWKKGLNLDDMDTIVSGFRANTVKYHPEMKQWIMICDIKFMDNKIKMRTASEFTGPWSDEISIYEIPEVTMGNPLFHKSNFCYLARECIQNYDPKRHVMTITYDINNSDFSEISSNPKIYTPKVITIPLRETGSR